MRVYELAKELGIASKDLVVSLKEAGLNVGSHMSNLSEADLVAARAFLNKNAKSSSGSLLSSQVSQTPSSLKSAPSSSKATNSVPVEQKKLKPTVEPQAPSSDSHSKKVDMTNKTSQVSSPHSRETLSSTVSGSFPKKTFEPHKKNMQKGIARASYDAGLEDSPEDEVLPLPSEVVLDEQTLEKLGTPPPIGHARGQEKFVKIFGEKRRPTSGRRRRRSFNKASKNQEQAPVVVTEFLIDGSMRVGDLSDAINKPASDLILSLLKRGMVCNINNVLQPEVIKDLLVQQGITPVMPQRIAASSPEASDERLLTARLSKEAVSGEKRSPVVVVMGHVDHGKTTLLDYVRKKNVAASERGGITQHLGAYEVVTKHGHIVFLDTPGHEAFSYIRRQGSMITDIAILVVAADDGIKPQTIEAIKHAKEAGVPIIVAINKIDKVKSVASLDTIKRQLAQYDLMTEDWGGQVICVPVSAKTGEGIDHLLEMIILQSQMMDLKARLDTPAKVFVLESRVEKGFGPVATGIVVEGELKQGDYFICGGASGKVRLLVDSYDKRLQAAKPSVPVKIVGFSSLESIGEWLTVVSAQEISRFKGSSAKDQDVVSQTGGSGRDSLQQFNESFTAGTKQARSLNLIIKTDTRGSKEALTGLIEKLARENKEINCPIRVIMTGIGDISEGDVELALNTGAYVVGLHVKIEKNAASFSKEKEVPILQYDIIYHLIEALQGELNKRREIKSTWEEAAELVVRKVFDIKGLGVIAGCYVREGVVARGYKAVCFRDKKQVGEGKISSLQRDKKTVKEVHAGYECGFISDTFSEWQEGDIVKVMREVKES